MLNGSSPRLLRPPRSFGAGWPRLGLCQRSLLPRRDGALLAAGRRRPGGEGPCTGAADVPRPAAELRRADEVAQKRAVDYEATPAVTDPRWSVPHPCRRCV